MSIFTLHFNDIRQYVWTEIVIFIFLKWDYPLFYFSLNSKFFLLVGLSELIYIIVRHFIVSSKTVVEMPQFLIFEIAAVCHLGFIGLGPPTESTW